MKILVHANCQVGPIGRMIESAIPTATVLRIAPVHKLTNDDLGSVAEAVRSADIVLSQPIGEAFWPFSMDALKTLGAKQSWVAFPSMYFGGLFPHLFYLRTNPGTLLGPLGEYHDRRIVRAYLEGLSVEATVARMAEEDDDLCRNHLRACIAESRRREAEIDIKYMDFVEETMSLQKPFHTFNHPANPVLWHVVLQFLNLIGIKPVAGARPAVNQWLDETIAAIPAEMGRVAGLQYSEPDYVFQKAKLPYPDLIAKSFGVYEGTPDIKSIAQDNGVSLI